MARRLRLALGQTPPAATVVAYPKPAGSPSSTWSVSVNGQPTWTHYTSRGSTATVSSDAAGALTVQVTAPTTVTAVDLQVQQPGVWPSPTISPSFSGTGITIPVPRGFNGNLRLRINNASQPDWVNWLSIGILPLETDIPAPGDVTHYFGPGVHTGGSLRLYSGQSVYVAGGAYVNRRILAGLFGSGRGQLSNIRIFGRGVIDTNNGYGGGDQGLGTMDIVGVDGFSVEGITYVSRYGWAIATYNCRDVLGDWLRLYSCEVVGASTYTGEGTPDGWDPTACEGWTLRRSFLSVCDDTVAIKGSKYGESGNSSTLLLEDLLCMQGGKSNGMDIGYELGTTNLSVTDVTYRRIVLADCWRDSQSFRTNALGIHVCSLATVDGVLFEDIAIAEVDTKDWQIFVSTFYTSGFSISLSGDANRGYIRNVTYRRVSWPSGGTLVGRITADLSDGGYEGGAKRLQGIRFEQCSRGGVALTAKPSEWTVTNADVTFVP